ncbi:hypothetical protein Ahy_B06g084558 [Arachis hypogaea]|uniref:Peptidase A2 domain-containing protein n=1 Tax=Arachis hypogaea TaxID=3818 RepID=A0A444YS76_ARAHY|nr:hypothetical protein Ahy_B06g084558 [Arachis hypogaea]
MEKGKLVVQSSRVDKNKEVDVDEEYFDEGDDDMIGTISIIPTEYLWEYKGDPDEDYDMEDEEAFSFIRIEDELGYFLRPTKKQMSHLRPLHITTIFGGIKVNKVLIDSGVAISLLPERMLMKVGKHPDDLVPTNIVVMDFSGASMYNLKLKSLNVDRTLNSYNCEGCYLSSEGLYVKLRYPELGFAPTVEFSHSLLVPSLCNGNVVAGRTADLVAKAHCIENRRNKGWNFNSENTQAHSYPLRISESAIEFRFIGLPELSGGA